MIVMKFGGSSVGSPENIKKVAEIINTNSQKIVVLSAMSGTTNQLVQISRYLKKKDLKNTQNLIKELEYSYLETAMELFSSQKYYLQAVEDIKKSFFRLELSVYQGYSQQVEKEILSIGEIVTTQVFKSYLDECNIQSELIPALNFMRKDAMNEPDYFYIQESLFRELNNVNSKVIITQGYICKNAQGQVDNLTRGGSDYTATIVGTVLEAKEIQIWSDKDGLLNNDPRFVEETFPIEEISYEEAEELAYFGAKILHPTCIAPVKVSEIPVLLKNTFNPIAIGTIINRSQTIVGQIKAIAAKDDITAINIKSGRMLNAVGFLRRIFEIFERYSTPVDMITTSEVAVSVTIDDNSRLYEIVEDLKALGEVEFISKQSIVCLVGNIPAEESGISNRIFNALTDIPLRMISYGASKRNMTILINQSDKIKTLNLLNQHLFERELCIINN